MSVAGREPIAIRGRFVSEILDATIDPQVPEGIIQPSSTVL
jgi:hypothetical protein